MRKTFSIPIMLCLSACATDSTGSSAAPSGDLAGPVTYKVSSWGRLLTQWQVNPDGSGEIWKGKGLGKGHGAVRKYRLRMSDEAMQAFVAKAEPLRRATENGIDCKRQITDMPYGSITWDYPEKQQSYAFDAGCRSAQADAAMEQLRAVSDVIEKMATIEAEPYMTDPGPS